MKMKKMKKIFLILIFVVVAMGLLALFRGNVVKEALAPQNTEIEPITLSSDTGTEAVEMPVGILPFDSGVMGKVLLGPVCPVVREGDESCNDKPYVTVINIFRAGNNKDIFSVTESDKEGGYKAMLPPGDYVLSPISGQMFPRCGEKTVTINPSFLSEVNLSCDTGIR